MSSGPLKPFRDGLQTVERALGVSVEVPDDLRRLLPLVKTRLIRLAVVLEHEDPSLSDPLEDDEPEEELDVSNTSCNSPG